MCMHKLRTQYWWDQKNLPADLWTKDNKKKMLNILRYYILEWFIRQEMLTDATYLGFKYIIWREGG